jgi:copper chaperone
VHDFDQGVGQGYVRDLTQQSEATMSVQSITIEVDNLKCGGCATTITKSLSNMAGISDVSVDADVKTVTFLADGSLRGRVVSKLKSLGYPEKGSAHGLEAGMATAKSYVSCAVGRLG